MVENREREMARIGYGRTKKLKLEQILDKDILYVKCRLLPK
jgi:hypothetical protein